MTAVVHTLDRTTWTIEVLHARASGWNWCCEVHIRVQIVFSSIVHGALKRLLLLRRRVIEHGDVDIWSFGLAELGPIPWLPHLLLQRVRRRRVTVGVRLLPWRRSLDSRHFLSWFYADVRILTLHFGFLD